MTVKSGCDIMYRNRKRHGRELVYVEGGSQREDRGYPQAESLYRSNIEEVLEPWTEQVISVGCTGISTVRRKAVSIVISVLSESKE